MKNSKLIVLAAAFIATGLHAQDTISRSLPLVLDRTTHISSSNRLVWSVGLSGVVIDDDGDPFGGLFNVGDSWNFLPYPTRAHVDVMFHPQWSVEGALTYTQMKAGKVMNDVPLAKDQIFFAFDANARFHFLKDATVFDPYGMGGLGFTFRSAIEQQTPTLNVGLGTNIWFIDQFGMNIQTSGKVKLNTKSSSYLMHSVGLLYRIN